MWKLSTPPQRNLPKCQRKNGINGSAILPKAARRKIGFQQELCRRNTLVIVLVLVLEFRNLFRRRIPAGGKLCIVRYKVFRDAPHRCWIKTRASTEAQNSKNLELAVSAVGKT